ncbi:FAD-dependent oxidoreductase [Kitasatospora azatica]|uniref:FAD-dependent oxidoreductase n=1 Tax=Kitasatospora azatica TaxID=58347 RepID=UPI000561FF24|nr:FAD-binding protein [Kitasatospora azatica]
MTDRQIVDADVVVVGGGPAASWAALTAARSGAEVVLADKGYCGTSGATAAGGTGVWYVQPDPAAREAAMASREALGGYLADRRWMARVLDQTYANMNELAERGRYPFPTGPDGRQLRNGLQGPEYMRRMRIAVRRAGVRILDHSPVTELLTTPDGSVAGAAGHRRQQGVDYLVRAGAVVLATGGCAFLSKALGTDTNTGDGALFAAEVGAELSGMEFSNAYGIAPEHTSVTKTAFYSFATFYRADGSELEGAGSQVGRSVIARTLLSEKVYCRNYLRHGERLSAALTVLDAAWESVRSGLHGTGAQALRTRQAAALAAHARWMYRSALARTETRGMAKRLDHPEQDPAQHHRIATGGLDQVWTRTLTGAAA